MFPVGSAGQACFLSRFPPSPTGEPEGGEGGGEQRKRAGKRNGRQSRRTPREADTVEVDFWRDQLGATLRIIDRDLTEVSAVQTPEGNTVDDGIIEVEVLATVVVETGNNQLIETAQAGASQHVTVRNQEVRVVGNAKNGEGVGGAIDHPVHIINN